MEKNMQSEGSNDHEWHLDKRIPIAVLGAIILQVFGFGVYASNISNAIADHERRIVTIEHTMIGAEGVSERLVRLEAEEVQSQKTLDRIETIVTTSPSTTERTHR